MRSRAWRLAWIGVLGLLFSALAACDGTISITFVTGPQELELSSSVFGLPAELDDGSGRIASYPCGPTGMCPPSGGVTLTCEAGVCDPAPMTVSGPVGGVIDVERLLAEGRELGIRRVVSFDVEQIAYDVTRNTLTLDAGPVTIFWGPEAATAIDPALGVRRFGTLPRVAAGTSPEGLVDIDSEGAAELGRYLVNTAQRVRFFAQTTVDLTPGDPYPQGALNVGVNVTITAVGRVLD